MANAITPLIQQYTVDFASNNNFLFVKGMQGDGYGTRYVDISLVNNGQPYTVNSEAVTVIIRGTKPDTSIIFNECEILDSNTIRVEITQQMSAVAGKGNYEVSIMSNLENRTLTSFPFFIIISKSSFDIGYVVSSNEFGLLVDKINQVHKIQLDLSGLKSDMQDTIKDCEDAKDECIDTTDKAKKIISDMNTLNQNISNAEAQRVLNENNRINAENIRGTKEIERNNAEQIRISNENTRKSAEITRNNNENDRAIAENARAVAEEARNTAEGDREDAEAIRQANEVIRQNQEQTRQTDTATAIANANTATANASTATNRANTISADLEYKVATDYYKGEPGKDGVITTIDINQLAFEVIDGHLIMTYETGNTDAQKFSINTNGHLIYTLSA